LQIGGKPLPLFVLSTNVEENLIFVGQGEDHPALYSAGLWVDISESHWVRPDLEGVDGGGIEGYSLSCRIRYRQALLGCKLLKREDENQGVLGYQVLFDKPLKSVTPGQFLAVYLGDEIVFSGVIAG
jgi:tRNA-specific 2-thiouridylase